MSTFVVADDRITHVHSIASPDKLTHLDALAPKAADSDQAHAVLV